MKATIRREVRVALSRRAQPLWVRVTKWLVALIIGWALWGTRWFWWFVLGGTAAALSLHFFYRWKTRGWTRPWGGWNDVDAGR